MIGEIDIAQVLSSFGIGGLLIVVGYKLVVLLIDRLVPVGEKIATAIDGSTEKIGVVEDVVQDTNRKVTTLVERQE